MPSENSTPAIRFAGFTGEWEQDKFGNLIQSLPYKPFIRSSEIDGTYAIIQQGNEPIVGYADGTPCEDYRDVIIFGDHTLSLYKPRAPFFVSTDGVRIIKSKTNQDAFFMLYLLEKNMPKSEGYKRYFAILCNQMCSSSSNLKEQQRLGLFFRDLDILITLHRRKCELLETLKKSMLEKLFPKEGELVPELRFAGFAGEWERRELGDVATFNPKDDLPNDFFYVDLESVVGTELVSRRKETKYTAPSRAQRLAQQGDLFYQTVRPYQKNNFLFDLSDYAYVFSTGYAQLRPIADGYFLLSYVQCENFVRVVMNNCSGTSYPTINPNDLARIEIPCPPEPHEENKVGHIFRAVDTLLTLHRRKLERLQNIKKACLEKMFV